jgi:hypothetical protein
MTGETYDCHAKAGAVCEVKCSHNGSQPLDPTVKRPKLALIPGGKL